MLSSAMLLRCALGLAGLALLLIAARVAIVYREQRRAVPVSQAEPGEVHLLPRGPLDLSGRSLRHANLVGANLAEADLSQADLSYARLTAADLSNADLSGANLLGADLTHARLVGTRFSGATMPDGSVYY